MERAQHYEWSFVRRRADLRSQGPSVQTRAHQGKGRITGCQEVEVDPGVSDKRRLIIEEEFAGSIQIMSREGNSLPAILRQAWDRGDLRTMTKNSPTKATGAHFTIVGRATQDEPLRYLDTTEAANGFANRFEWACVRRSKFLPRGGDLRFSTL
jgi:hypothetical protein